MMDLKGYRWESHPDYIFNAPEMKDATRMVDIGPIFAPALHTCTVEDGELVSERVGWAEDKAAIQDWLDG